MRDNKISVIRILCKHNQIDDYVWEYIQDQLINDHSFQYNFHISKNKR